MKNNLCKIAFIFIYILQFSTFSFCDDIDKEIIDVYSDIQSFSNTISSNQIKVPEINSRAAVVIDRNSNNILYGKNENIKRKMASTTKIMTALIVIENSDLTRTVEISKKAANTGGSRLGLKTNDKITVLDLLYGLMLKSGNDAAVALAEYVSGDISNFSKLMNQKASNLNLNSTHFETPHGLDSENHYTTAYELAILSNYALKNEIFSKIVGTKNYTIMINGYPKSISNTNELLGNLDGVYGIKTGFTNGANRCLVTACKRNNIDIICVVLGADTKKFRTQDSIKLINYVFNNFEVLDIENLVQEKFQKWKEKNINNFAINKGISNNIELILDNINQSNFIIRKDFIDSTYIDIKFQNSLNAPIRKNDVIGTVYVYNSNLELTKINILSDSYIEHTNIIFYFLYFIKNFNEIVTNSLLL